MARQLATLMTTLALGACNLQSGGSGLGSDAMPSDGGTADTGGSEGMDTTAATAPPGDDSDGPSMDEGPSEHPMLTISDGPFDFGSQTLEEPAEQTFTVTNEGDGDATALQVEGLDGAFSIVAHDCGEVLAPAATCDVQVRFVPTLFGDVQTELQITFQDQGMGTMVSQSLVGRGVGMIDELVINGGGEDGSATDIPPMGWTIGYGPNWSASSMAVEPVEPTRTIWAGWGPPDSNAFTLEQQVDIASLTTWGDGEGLQIHYQAFHRSEDMGDDPTRIELRFLDSAGGEVESHPGRPYSGTDWNMSTGSFEAPPGAHDVEISLQCDRTISDVCNGFFDGVELWAEWAG